MHFYHKTRSLFNFIENRLKDRIDKDIHHLSKEIELSPNDFYMLHNIMREALHVELRQISEYILSDRPKWLGIELRDEFEDDLRRQNEALSEVERRLNKRLAVIQNLLETKANPCRYGEGDSTNEYSQFITVRTDFSMPNKLLPDTESFEEKLQSISRQARSLVLVDPYALSDHNDAGDKGDSVKQIDSILDLKNSSIEALHLYVRPDAVTLKVWEKLKKNLGKTKLTVHTGDLHDRYLLAGSDKNLKRADVFAESWHNYHIWTGVVFGASLNGVSKRPTYVLPFEPNDVRQIRAYLDNQTSIKTIDSKV